MSACNERLVFICSAEGCINDTGVVLSDPTNKDERLCSQNFELIAAIHTHMGLMKKKNPPMES